MVRRFVVLLAFLAAMTGCTDGASHDSSSPSASPTPSESYQPGEIRPGAVHDLCSAVSMRTRRTTGMGDETKTRYFRSGTYRSVGVLVRKGNLLVDVEYGRRHRPSKAGLERVAAHVLAGYAQAPDSVVCVGSENRPAVLVVQNEKNGGPRRFGDWLAEDGLRLEVVRAYDGPTPPRTLTHDAVLVLGGGYMPDADDRAPWLAQTRALVGEALSRAVPMFGICLGGQLLAHVAGGAVKADVGAPEAGSVPVTLRPEAATDPLFHDLPTTVPAIEHHVDAITALPADAAWLAQTEPCPYQAFRVGECAWGVQFHPEVTPDRIPQWNADRLRAQGYDPDEVHARAVADEPVSTPIWREVCHRFATVVHHAAA